MTPIIKYYPTIPCPECADGREPSKVRPVFVEPENGEGYIREICSECGGRKRVIDENLEQQEDRQNRASDFHKAIGTLHLTMLQIGNAWGVPASVVSDLKIGRAYIVEENPAELLKRASR